METCRRPEDSIPRRIWVVGPCGSGKSTLATRLGTALDLPVTHLDAIRWAPGWVETDGAAFRRRVDEIMAADAWVIDGNARIWRRVRTKQLVCNGNIETFTRVISPRHSILWWSIRTHRWRRRMLNAELATIPHRRLRTPVTVESLLAGINNDERPFTM